MMPLNEKNKPYESIYSNKLFRVLGNFFADLLINTKITPAQVTFLNNIFAVIAAILFLFGTREYIITGSLFMVLSHSFDYADGSIARRKSLCSKYGEWLDETSDKLIEPIVFICAVAGQFFIKLDFVIWIWGSLAITSRLSTVILVCNTERFTGSDRKILKAEVGQNVFTKLFMFNKSNTVLLLLICSAFNKLEIFFIIISLYGMLFNFLSFFYLNRAIRRAGLDTPVDLDE